MTCAEQQGDDLILAPGRRPYIKRLGRVEPLDENPLTARQVEALLLPHLSMVQREDLKALRDVDFSHEVIGKGLRFRANIFRQLGGMSAVFRIVKGTIPDLEELGLPAVAMTFGDFRNGLVLVGGPTGSGKSTTLAAIIDYINRTSSRHIISLEDPIEVLHPKKQGLVNQREMGTHTSASATALRSTLRQDPNVLLIGEMRDLPTISFAVAAAETGHLVFGTLHTVSADTTVDRLINAFPDTQQQQVRSMLADSLRAVLCQLLLPRMDGKGRCLAAEVLLNNDAVANVIRKGKTYQLPSIITTSRELGMHSMDGELKRLVQAGLVAPEEAYMRAANKKEFEGPDDATPEEPGTATWHGLTPFSAWSWSRRRATCTSPQEARQSSDSTATSYPCRFASSATSRRAASSSRSSPPSSGALWRLTRTSTFSTSSRASRAFVETRSSRARASGPSFASFPSRSPRWRSSSCPLPSSDSRS
jgi:twitching motility protein PilT